MLSGLASMFRIETLVYQFIGFRKKQVPVPGVGRGVFFRASESSIHFLFSEDAIRRRLFLRFLRDGFSGVFLVRNGRWVSYGWYTSPGAGRPPHLPPWAGQMGAYWIFHCRTREEYRNQGNYKRLLAQIAQLINVRDDAAWVLCDTLPDNFASRSAVLQSGFRPAGVLTSYCPVPGVFLKSLWDRQREHFPPLEYAAEAAPRRAAG